MYKLEFVLDTSETTTETVVRTLEITVQNNGPPKLEDQGGLVMIMDAAVTSALNRFSTT